jgi:hypothetical protein
VKVSSSQRSRARSLIAKRLTDAGMASAQASAMASAMVNQAAVGLEAGRRPEDPNFVTDQQAQALLDSLKATPDVVKVGKEGYVHGWKCVRPPCGKVGDAVDHGDHGPGVITKVHPSGEMHARFSDGHEGTLGKPKVPVTTLAGLGQKPEEGHHATVPAKMTGEQEKSFDQLGEAAKKSGLVSRDELDKMHDELHSLQSALAKETKEGARKDLALHIGIIVAGLVLAAIVAGMAAPIAVALAVGVLPTIGVEIATAHSSHQTAHHIESLGHS